MFFSARVYFVVQEDNETKKQYERLYPGKRNKGSLPPVTAPREVQLLCGIGRLLDQLLRELSPFTLAHAGEHLF